ncbi:YciC family protein [Brevundimonas sp.]|uniref:YciC family protein n=1 Tax=Brevundimonas sp. TaxID=1871086 RepID=UPI002FC7890A
MTTTDYNGGVFDLGRVMQKTFEAISRNWVVFLGAAVLLVGIPSLISGYGQITNTINEPFAGLAFVSIGGILSVVGTYVLQGMVVFAAVNGFNGKSVDLGSALSVGLRFFFPLFGLAILMALGLGLGFLLLIVPGVILAVIWVVASPALVVENRGILESFQRSRDLTRGNRWRIFALLVVYLVLSWMISWIVMAVGVAAGGNFATASTFWGVAMVLSPLVNILTGVVSSAGVAAVYYELRRTKEGVSPDQLASVFD